MSVSGNCVLLVSFESLSGVTAIALVWQAGGRVFLAAFAPPLSQRVPKKAVTTRSCRT